MYTDPANFPSEEAAKKKLVNNDIVELSTLFGLNPAAIMSVFKVETGGRSGYDAHNRPKILFEGHVFYNLIKANAILLDTVMKKQKNNICYKSWGERGTAYKLDQYTRLEEAISFDKKAALQSASWGIGQIMGMNYKACGCNDVETFVKENYFSEKKQLQMMLGFVKANPKMYEALKSLNWTGFAKRYNGPGYKVNKYDTKLLESYNSYNSKTIFI